MDDKEKRNVTIPEMDEVEKEIRRVKYKREYGKTIRSTISILVAVAAVAVLVSTLLMPVLKIYGTSMNPTLKEGEIVVSLKNVHIGTGDVIAFYYNNKILTKRVIAGPGSWVDIDADGTVYVDNKKLDEPYLTEKALGDCNIELPYQVPDERYFVMGDHRSTSVDSRNTSVGCVAKEFIVGKILFTVWPLNEIREIH